MPEISIIIPVYNMENFLRECLRSIQAQNYDDYEVILVDDGSTDNSFEIAISLAEEDSNIQVVHKENEGVSVARNTGMELAKGTWVMFIDPDDTLTPNFFEQMLPLTISEGVDIVACCCNAIGNGIKDVDYFFNSDRLFVTFEEKKDLYKQLLDAHYGQTGVVYTAIGVPWGKLYRRSFLQEANLKFNPRLKRYQDNIFNMYAFFYARKIRYINQPLYNYRLEHIQKFVKVYNQEYVNYMTALCDERYVCMNTLGLLGDEELKEYYCLEMLNRLWNILKNNIFTSENKATYKQKKSLAHGICERKCFQPLFEASRNDFSKKDFLKREIMKNQMFRVISVWNMIKR